MSTKENTAISGELSQRVSRLAKWQVQKSGVYDDTRIPQNESGVNSYSMQKSKKDAQNGELSIDTAATDDHAVAELTAQSNALKDQTLGKYTTQMGEQATQSDVLSQFDIENDIGLYDDPLYPTSKRDQSAFDRSLANKTTGLKNGEVRGIIINTANHCYFVVADGYMHGYIYKRMGITGNKTIFKELQEEFINGFNEDGKDIDGDFEIMWGRNGRRSRNTLTAAKRGGTEKIVSLDDGKSGRSNVGDDTQGYGVVGRIDNTAEFIPQNRKRHITNSVLYPDNKVERIRFNRELSERSTINQVNNIFIETKYHLKKKTKFTNSDKISTYIEKGGKGQEFNVENSPQLTSETFLDSNATKDIVANETKRVKRH